ncbi:prepilin peptidase [Aminipila terrae]|uniref:Prepilin type IV endopeptidase peptidase domain-containing protein n=1 Tax=Aminipila terrae TaxID=2697030 RepID=A0A6P1MH57_9FIRM|nr:A24 family peptidase [Aminipila terrae]QHI71348.1 hypothetical protein Ami3637_02090 [Aminipila terrae]
MNIYLTLIFGILGISFGMVIPHISNGFVTYKKLRNNSEIVVKNCDIRTVGLVVVLNGVLWSYAGSKTENIFITLLVSLLFTVAILISLIDLKIRLIPNELVLFILFLGAVFQILYFGWMALLYALICMVAVGFMFIMAGKLVGLEQVGAGDVKLAAAMGLILGYPDIKIGLIGMSGALIAFCLGGMTIKKLTMYSFFPLAPFIMFGTICSLIYIIGW